MTATFVGTLTTIQKNLPGIDFNNQRWRIFRRPKTLSRYSPSHDLLLKRNARLRWIRGYYIYICRYFKWDSINWFAIKIVNTKNVKGSIKNSRIRPQFWAYETLTPLGRFPSMASFLSRQSEQRKGPCQGLELVEKIEPAWTEMPSLGARSTWQTAQTKIPDVDCPVFKLSSFPNLHT